MKMKKKKKKLQATQKLHSLSVDYTFMKEYKGGCTWKQDIYIYIIYKQQIYRP
jgi:hypothetical protein